MKKNVLMYLEKTLLEFSNKIAIRSHKKELTFGELDRYARELGQIIHKRYTEIKRPIAVYLPKSEESLIAFIGVLYSGNAYVPLDVHSPIVRTKSILEDLELPVIITSQQYHDTIITAGVCTENLIFIEEAFKDNEKDNKEELFDVLESVIDTDPAYIIFTSGSTGDPKGVVVSHRSIIDYIDWAAECFKITHKEIIGSQSPFYFDNSTLDIYLTLATGSTFVIIPDQLFAFPVRLMEYVASNEINFIFWVPSVLINTANLRALDYIDVGCLKKILFAGEVMPNKHLNYWRKRLPEALYANLYGPTEITVDCTYYIVQRDFDDSESLPIGFPCRNTAVLLLNQDNKSAAQGEIGELCVRGSSLALGYWKDFKKSDTVFTQNPLNPYYFDRIYKTGDLVYQNEYGEIIFTGRKDNQIKHMGYRIELGEIENAVLSLDGIENGCVIYNQDKNEIVLFYEGINELEERKIRTDLIQRLPKYMIPTRFYRFDKLLLNNNGKIDRRALKELLIHN